LDGFVATFVHNENRPPKVSVMPPILNNFFENKDKEEIETTLFPLKNLSKGCLSALSEKGSAITIQAVTEAILK
jgi:hypothetical protein